MVEAHLESGRESIFRQANMTWMIPAGIQKVGIKSSYLNRGEDHPRRLA